MVGKLTQGVLRLYLAMLTLSLGMLRLCSGLLALSSGKSGRCSRSETKTEPAQEKDYIEFRYPSPILIIHQSPPFHISNLVNHTLPNLRLPSFGPFKSIRMSLVIHHRLVNFFLGVENERSVLNDFLIEREACY
jgi:hypothetical protein